MKTTITEIRNFLKAIGADLRKARAQINGQPAYEINYRDGGFKFLTERQLKEAYLNGAL